MRLPLACAVAGLLASAACAAAVELRPVIVRKGVEGLDPAPLAVTNGAPGPIVCVAELAHWYSLALGRARMGETLSIPLWRDPQSGAVVVLNDAQENMPVEALWCGLEGRSYETRAALGIARTRHGPLPRAATCRNEDGRLVCG